MAPTNGIRSADNLLHELSGISDMISQNTDEAAKALDNFKTRNHSVGQKSVRATMDLLTLVIASIRNAFDKQGIDDVKLTAYFKKEKKFDEAAQVLLAKARHFFQNGNLAEGEKVLTEISDELLGYITPRTEVVYLTRMAFIYDRRHQYDEKMKVSLQALDKLKEMGEPGAWHYNISTIFYTNIAGCYFYQSDFDKALPYLNKSLEITERNDISAYNKFNVYSYFAFYYESTANNRMSAGWQEKIIDLLRGDATHQNYLIQAYLMAIIQYSFLYRRTTLSTKEKQMVVGKQDRFLEEVATLIPPDTSNGNYIMFLYVNAMLGHQKGNHEKANIFLNRCLPLYEKMQHRASVLNCYRLRHEIYYAWGKETKDAPRLLKAYEYKQKESMMIEEDSRQSHLQKLEAVQVKYNLQQEELNRKLLQQQMEAMNKEIQLTAINLNEKIRLLDELKGFMLSLKKKDGGQHMIRTIIQKIGAVKITEQEKAILQQKMDDGNYNLFKILAEMYPSLTTHEVRTCGLIKTGLTDKELSRLYGSGERGYEQLRHRIKKKMKLKRNQNLVKHLMDLCTKVRSDEVVT
ncbi:MAG: hypothetical protein JWO03_3085 [Bacteroidetes bacterium]|nr:hypothetical protein [Bacteroidota bacterium]